LGIFLRVHTRTHTTLTSYTRLRVHTHGREKIGETCISAERAHACIHSNLGMDALCLARGVAPPTLLLPYECAHVEDNLHLQGLFSCFTVKDLYLLLSAPWPFGLTWYKRKEKKNKKGWGWSWKEGWVEPNAAPREEEAGAPRHTEALPLRQEPSCVGGAQSFGCRHRYGPRESPRLVHQTTRGNRAFNGVKLRPVSLLPTLTGGPCCAYLILVPRG
jgi:hypothetical protein